MARIPTLAFAFIGLLGVAISSCYALSVSITDDTFNPPDWSQDLSKSAPGTAAGFSQVLSGGNPGSFGQVNLTIAPNSSAALMTYCTGQSYSPVTQGAIDSISFSGDFKAIAYSDDIYFGFKQGGTLYLLQTWFSYINGPSWTNVTCFADSALMFQDRLSSNPPPDFVDGAPLEFGIYMSYLVSDTQFQSSLGMDNFQVAVTTIPEPATITLAACGLGIIVMVVRRFRKERGRPTASEVLVPLPTKRVPQSSPA
jgi:hypothetical protein